MSKMQLILDDGDIADMGPEMAALPNDKWRAFVLAMFQVAPGRGSLTASARLAGFGTAESTPQTMAVIAHRIAHDPRTLAAIKAEGWKRIHVGSPDAINALFAMVQNPFSKHHFQAVELLMNRVYPSQTTHNVNVTHKRVDRDEEAVNELRALLALGTPKEKLLELFGPHGLERVQELANATKESAAKKAAKARVVEAEVVPTGREGLEDIL